MSDGHLPVGLEPRHDEPAGRLHAQLALVGQALVADEDDEAARTVAALLDLAAVGVEDPVAEVRVASRALDQQHLVAAHAEAAIGEQRVPVQATSRRFWRTPSSTTKSLPRPCILVNLECCHCVVIGRRDGRTDEFAAARERDRGRLSSVAVPETA